LEIRESVNALAVSGSCLSALMKLKMGILRGGGGLEHLSVLLFLSLPSSRLIRQFGEKFMILFI